MAFPKLNFTKSWKNAVDFPTVETNETKVRADMQYLFDELRDALNGIVDKLNGKKLDDYPSGGVVTTLGTDNTTIPTSKAVRDAMSQTSQLPSGGVVKVLGTDHTTVPTSKAVRDAMNQAGQLPSGGVVTTLGTDDTTVPTSKAVRDAMTQAGQLPSGGTPGQALVKKSGTNFDMQWATIPGFSQGKTGTLTEAGWSNGSQTITVSGVTASGNVLVAPSPASQDAYAAAGVKCTAQAANSLTFTCKKAPAEALTVNVVLLP